MEGTIINNASTTVQVYMVHLANSQPPTTTLEGYQSGQLSTVGNISTADVDIFGSGDYVYCAIWEIDTFAGPPNSWLLYSKTDGSIKHYKYSKYSATVSGDHNTGWIITLTNGPNTSQWILLIGLILLIVLISSGVIIFFI